MYLEDFLTVVVLISTFKNKNSVRTMEAGEQLCKNLRTMRLGQNLLVLIKTSVYLLKSQNEGLPWVFREQGNRGNFAMGTREHGKKNGWEHGNRHIPMIAS